MWTYLFVNMSRALMIVIIAVIFRNIDTIPETSKNILVLVLSFMSGCFTHTIYTQLI